MLLRLEPPLRNNRKEKSACVWLLTGRAQSASLAPRKFKK